MKKWSLLLVLVLLASTLGGCYPFNEQKFTGEVTDVTETVSDGENLKLVEVNDKDWYSVEDEFFAGQFRSRDLWGSLKVGKTYEFTSYGWRIGIVSAYPNITEATEVK